MKTPRKILFHRHAAADAKLDALRRKVVAQLPSTPAARREPLPLHFALTLWREHIRPARYIWAGVAATWVLIFGLNFSARETSTSSLAQVPPPSPQALAAWRQQFHVLAALTEINPPRPVVAPPKPTTPQPRSNRRPDWFAA